MDTNKTNKHYNINQKDEGTYDDRGRDGGTYFILRIKEQETRLTLQEHDDDDDEIVKKKCASFWSFSHSCIMMRGSKNAKLIIEFLCRDVEDNYEISYIKAV